jgi:GTP-binding protein
VRHPLTELDWQMLEWFAPTGKPVHVLLTKSDKLTRTERNHTLNRVIQELSGAPIPITVQLFSSLDATGLAEAQIQLTALLGDVNKGVDKGENEGAEGDGPAAE